MKISINKRYNFLTLAPALLGSDFTNMKAVGMYNAQEASKSMDVQTLHKNMRSLTTGIPDDVNDLTYISFENLDGNMFTIPYEYIAEASIVETSVKNIRVNIFNCNDSDLAVLRTVLMENGYANFDMTTTS